MYNIANTYKDLCTLLANTTDIYKDHWYL